MHELPQRRPVDRHRQGLHAASRRRGHLLRSVNAAAPSPALLQLRERRIRSIGNPNTASTSTASCRTSARSISASRAAATSSATTSAASRSRRGRRRGRSARRSRTRWARTTTHDGRAASTCRRCWASSPAALRPQRRLRDARLRGRRREAPHRQRHAARRADGSRQAGQGGRVRRIDRREDQAVPLSRRPCPGNRDPGTVPIIENAVTHRARGAA